MELFVADASMAIAWVHPAQATAEADTWLTHLENEADLAVPAIWPLEIANALLVLERRRKLKPAERKSALSFFRSLRASIDGVGLDDALGRIADLAERETLSVYDACYLDVALRRDVPLACKDGPLRAAAVRRKVRVEP